MNDLTEVLALALQRLLAGEGIASILADYPGQPEALASLLHAATQLETLRPVELPTAEASQADRAQFLAQVVALQQQPVSLTLLERLKAWQVHIFPWRSLSPYQRKEQRRMSTLLIKMTLIFGVVFGSAGGTAVLAANSLPESPLYPLKLTMEQTRTALTTDPVAQANLQLTLAQVRAQEMQQMALAGDVPDEAIQSRLQQHLNQAFQLAAQLPDGEMLPLLTRAQQMLQTQEQLLTQTQAQVGQPEQAALGQADQVLNQARQQAQAGLQDPQSFRWRYQHGTPEVSPTPCNAGECEPAGDQNQNQQRNQHQSQPGPQTPLPGGSCTSGDCEPAGDQNQYQHRNGPQTPEPSGSCTTGDCEPVGDQNQFQRQNQQRDTVPSPTPGGGPCNTGECEPVGDEHHYGQEADQPGGPHSTPDCSGDCEPVGDQNQNQYQNQNQNQNEAQPASTSPAQPEPNNSQSQQPESPPAGTGGGNAGGDNNSGNSGDNGGNTSGDSSSSSGNSSSNNGGNSNSDSGGGGKK